MDRRTSLAHGTALTKVLYDPSPGSTLPDHWVPRARQLRSGSVSARVSPGITHAHPALRASPKKPHTVVWQNVRDERLLMRRIDDPRAGRAIGHSWREHLVPGECARYCAPDSCQGRLPGTEAIDSSHAYLADASIRLIDEVQPSAETRSVRSSRNISLESQPRFHIWYPAA